MLKKLLVTAAVAGAIASVAAPAGAQDCLLYVRLSDANGTIVEECVNV